MSEEMLATYVKLRQLDQLLECIISALAERKSSRGNPCHLPSGFFKKLGDFVRFLLPAQISNLWQLFNRQRSRFEVT